MAGPELLHLDGRPFLKGHGTENDFVLLPDLDGTLRLEPEAVRRLCDRRAGLGADGVLRVVPSRLEPATAGLADAAPWFMDHRNADGTTAQMCGNGIRLFARYLVRAGLAAAGNLQLATRDDIRQVQIGADDGPVVVDMGPAQIGDPLLIDGEKATSVSMGNPHAVLAVESVAALGVLRPERTDLNVEYVQDLSPTAIAMRVHERGVGETRSCGTGACAAVVATSLRTGAARGTPFEVTVPGGQLVVTWRTDGHVLLSGPAVIVAEGRLDAGLLGAWTG